MHWPLGEPKEGYAIRVTCGKTHLLAIVTVNLFPC